MENEFSLTELRLITGILKRSVKRVESEFLDDLAELLRRPPEEVKSVVTDILGKGNLTNYQRQVEAKVNNKTKERRRDIQQIIQTEKKEKKERKKNAANINRQAKVSKEKEKKINAERERLLEKQKRQIIEQERELARKKRYQPLFRTRQVDYSQMISVRIDSKTTIYARPGEDIEAVKKKYRQMHNK